jgi:ParB family chromosome partitioning protein
MSNFNLADYIQPPAGAAKPAERKLQMIPTRKIFANDKNFYDTSKVDDLIDSILMQGLLDPLTVRPSGDGEGYIIISGHRRHRALMTILDDHLAEDTKPFETTPCFVREPGDELMEELMLIQANSATRVLTSAETSKQVDRVRDLLYGLKSQGYEFPGRMRDYVASACNISASKIARLDTIKTKLIPQIKQYYDDGRMPESVAYEIAKCSADDQQLIAKVKGNGQDGLGAMRCGEAERILSDRDSLAARKCKYACGVPCGNMVKSLQKTTGNYMRSCEHTCCMECYDIATCDKYCKVAKDRHLQLREDKAKTEQCREERWREERKQRADKCAAYWARLHDAIDQHGHSAELAAVMHITETALEAGDTYYAPYRQCMPEELDALVAAADILGVTTDYLLGRTDNPHFTTLPQRESKKEDDA